MTVHTFTMTDSSIVDLTSTTINPDAAATSTPRQGGFTLRNRWDCAKLALNGKDVLFAAAGIVAVTSTTAVVWTHNPFNILDVPARTMVRDISIFGVHGKTRPNSSFYYSGSYTAAGNTASNIKTATLTFYAAPWKKNTGASVATHVDGFGEIDLSAVAASTSGGVFGGSKLAASWSTSSSSKISTPTNAGVVMENTMASMANAATSFRYPLYFPHGGRIIMKLADATTALSQSSATTDTELAKYSGKISGVWEVQANCNYLPV